MKKINQYFTSLSLVNVNTMTEHHVGYSKHFVSDVYILGIRVFRRREK